MGVICYLAVNYNNNSIVIQYEVIYNLVLISTSGEKGCINLHGDPNNGHVEYHKNSGCITARAS